MLASSSTRTDKQTSSALRKISGMPNIPELLSGHVTLEVDASSTARFPFTRLTKGSAKTTILCRAEVELARGRPHGAA